jgi:hypothetical protein
LPRFSLNQSSKIILGTVLTGLCLTSFAQTVPLATPKNTAYPGIIQTFEKLIQIDNEKMQKRTDILVKNGRLFTDASSVKNLELEPDFLNSIVLHSDPGYLRLASSDKCRFYETILTDLLKSADGKIRNIIMTYVEKDLRQSALISKKDFLTKVVNQECPETQKNIAAFQVKTLDKTLSAINFDIPTGVDQCRNIHVNWVNNPKTPFLCQVYEYVKEAEAGGGDPKDLPQRRAVAKILQNKQTMVQKDYIENLCKHLDDEDLFCEEFLNVSFWAKVAGGQEDKIYAEDICRQVIGSSSLSQPQYFTCLTRLKKEKDLCFYPAGRNSGLRPLPDCDQLSTALNFSSLKASYRDCPGNSDQLIATNMGRIINHFSSGEIPQIAGSCSSLSAGMTFNFNKTFDNDENWKLEACYDDRLNEKEVCTRTFFGTFGNLPESYTTVVADILKRTRGADQSIKCQMLDSSDYNPLLLQYKSGCFIIFDRDHCFISECKHKILYNDRLIDFIKIKNRATLAYFPLNVREERFSQHYLLTRDFKKSGKSLNNLSSITKFFKKTKNGIVHGVGCAEDLLPTFFKSNGMNQCTGLPFTISGVLKDKDKVVFITRTGADSVQAPRLLSWSIIYSGVKSYQRTHPLKQWTMYGLD